MTGLKIIGFVAITLIITMLAGPPASAQEPLRGPRATPAFVEGELLVKFKPQKGGLSVQNANQKVAEVNGRVVDVIPGLGTLKVKIPPGKEVAAVAKLSARPDVEYVELNYIAYAFETPNDSELWRQWGLGQIDVFDGWDITQGSSEMTVAILDTGVDLDHPDFNCTVSDGAAKLTAGWDFVNGDSDPDDGHSHGTHVAGIVGACTNNNLGVAGLVPNVRLMPVKVLSDGGSGSYSGVANGIIYAVNNGADIVNLSLGGSTGNNTLQDAVEYANINGVLVVAATGNDGIELIYYPAAYPETIAVGATDFNDERAGYSNYGSQLDVVAPGSGIYSTVINGYGYKSGTSMATPYVAGLAALIWSADPGLTHTEVRQVIQESAYDLDPPGKDIEYGYGRIDVFRALEPYGVRLQTSAGQLVTPPITFITDDQAPPAPQTITIDTAVPDVITWTTVITPPVSWLSLSAETSGLVVASTQAQFTLTPTRPFTYGEYSTNVVVTGTTATGFEVGPTVNEVRINYMDELHRYYFPIMFKN